MKGTNTDKIGLKQHQFLHEAWDWASFRSAASLSAPSGCPLSRQGLGGGQESQGQGAGVKGSGQKIPSFRSQEALSLLPGDLKRELEFGAGHMPGSLSRMGKPGGTELPREEQGSGNTSGAPAQKLRFGFFPEN